MKNIDKFINNINKVSKQLELSEIEKLRYIYISLGFRFNFNNEFSCASKIKKKQMYDRPKTNDIIENDFNSKVIICKDLAYIVNYILNGVGIDSRLNVYNSNNSLYPHMNNIVKIDDKEFIIDLQQDIENIQSNSRTSYFGLDLVSKEQIFNRKYLEQIDYKIGYIKKDQYYLDEYIELLKYYVTSFSNDLDAICFVLENIDGKLDKKISFPEIMYHHKTICSKVLNRKQNNKLLDFVCQKKTQDGENIYIPGFSIIENAKCEIIYIYDKSSSKYVNYDYSDLYNLKQLGFILPRSPLGFDKFIKDNENKLNKLKVNFDLSNLDFPKEELSQIEILTNIKNIKNKDKSQKNFEKDF